MTVEKVQVLFFARHQNQWHVLLLQTNEKRGSFWQNITGGVERGEQFDDAAARELREETGRQSASPLHDLNLEFTFTNRRGQHAREKVFFAIGEYGPITLDPQEHQQYQWIPTDNITPQHYQYASNYQAFQKALQVIAHA